MLNTQDSWRDKEAELFSDGHRPVEIRREMWCGLLCRGQGSQAKRNKLKKQKRS